MKTKIIAFIIVQAIVLLLTDYSLYAWKGESPFEAISRETIIRRASEMTNFSWSPVNAITNWNYTNSAGTDVYYIYNAGTIYDGEAYSQTTPYDQYNWSDFYSAVNDSNTKGYTKIGNDCAGFVSINWKLPTRYTTWNFENDAVADGGYVTSLGAKGDGIHSILGLLYGDALVKRTISEGHIILFESYLSNGSGISAIEQTPDRALRHSTWSWSRLASYRPIRRNKIDEGNYVFKTKWGKQGDLNGQFNWPRGIEVDSSGNVFVADVLNDRLQKFTSDGIFIIKWGTAGCGNSQFYGVLDVASDKSGNIYAVDSESIYCSAHVRKFTNSGSFLTMWGSSGEGNGQFQGDINGITADLSGNIYVTNCRNNRVQKFTNNGSFISKWGSFGNGHGQFNCPQGIAVDIFGNVFVSDYNNRIQKFLSNGSFITEWGSCCSPDGYFDNPAGVAVDSSGNVYVADQGNHRIQKFDNNGNFITKWGSNGWTGNGQFQYPEGVAVDAALNVYVADTYNDRIQKFAPVPKLPTGPSNLTATAVSSSQINLSWKDTSNNETGFKIKRKTGVNGIYTTIATLGANATSYSNTGLTAGMTYYYDVWAYNSYGESAYSDEVSAITGGGTVIQQATLNGNPWSGSLTYQCSLDGVLGPVQTVNLPVTATNRPPGTRICSYISGGPIGAVFTSITPSNTQMLYPDGTITFTYNFKN